MKLLQTKNQSNIFRPSFTESLDRWSARQLVAQPSRRHNNKNWSPLGHVEACAFTKHRILEALSAKASGLFALGIHMAGSSFSLKIDTTQLEAGVDANVQRQVPYAVSVALNRTAQAVMAAEVKKMHDVFDRATPYTLSALRVKFATKARLVAEVSYKDESFKGTPATKYLAPEVDGGSRSVKRVESLLRSRGLLPSDMYVVPGAAAKLDQYGNFSRGQYSQILAQLQASRDRAQNETKTSRARKRRNPAKDIRYFVGRPGGGKLPLGVWARYQFAQGYAVRPVLMFVSTPHYSKLFPFYETAESMSAATLPTEMQAALAMAMRTRR